MQSFIRCIPLLHLVFYIYNFTFLYFTYNPTCYITTMSYVQTLTRLPNKKRPRFAPEPFPLFIIA